ncbi:sugar phosphate isomerase/epimerase family protein [Emticicia fontis]
MEKSNNPSVSRRQFLGTAATLVSGSVLASNSVFGAPAFIKNLFGPNSLINGVQIGAITYSFREMPDQSAEAVLQYVKESGISAIELLGDHAEVFAGRPKSTVDMRSVFPLMRKRNEKKEELTEEEKKKLADAEAAMKSFNAEVAKWRETVSMAKFEELGKAYKSAGISIYAFKPNAFGKNNSDAEITYGMKAAKALGANQITLEHPSDDAHTLKLGTMAQKMGVKVGYHGHEQQTFTLWDTALSQSPANSLNLDLGHFVAAGNANPLDIIKQKHERIVSMHIKDRQTPAHGKGNVAWGQGDTPIREALNLMKDNKYKFPATIELEYKIPEGSNSVAEVKKCLEFCKNSLS